MAKSIKLSKREYISLEIYKAYVLTPKHIKVMGEPVDNDTSLIKIAIHQADLLIAEIAITKPKTQKTDETD